MENENKGSNKNKIRIKQDKIELKQIMKIFDKRDQEASLFR